VVDDDPDMAEAMLLVLESAGYAARSAHNGRQALDEVAVQLPSLILLDMLMPVMNGWQFAHELHERYGHAVPIVVVSAAEHVRARSEEIDADDVLSKPFDMNDLLQIVKRYA
jgi:CheY-like chemotaxis protein